jgi:YVTN family beta-propeller protein
LACASTLAAAGLVGVTAGPAHAATTMNLAYVLDKAGYVRVVDVTTSTIIDTIPVGTNPTRIVASPDKRTAYVLNNGGYSYGNTLSVIDAATGTVTHTIPVCGGPETEAVSPDGSRLWVACDSSGLTEIDTKTSTVTRTVPSPAVAPVVINDLAFAPDGTRLYGGYTHSTAPLPYTIPVLSPVDSSLESTFIAPQYGVGVVVSPDASAIFIGQQSAGSVGVINAATGRVTADIPLGGTPDGGVMNPAGTDIYYCIDGSSIAVVNVASRSVTRTLTAPCGPGTNTYSSLSVTPDGTTLYADLGSGGIPVIDIASGTVTATIPTGAQLTQPTAAVAMVQAALVPAVTAVSPGQGPEAGNGTVTITGGPFIGGGAVTAVSFGGVPAASFTVDSDTQITAVAPAQTFRTVDVTVTNANGTSAVTTADEYTYLEAPPTISGLTPASGVSSGGTTVVITGTDLSTTKDVYFGGTAASSFTVDSDTQVTAVTRAQTNGTVNVSVTNSAGISTPVPGSQFTFFSPVPVVTAVSPAAGSTLGGDTVTITGLRFTGTFRVTFGGIAVPYTLDSDSQIIVVTPPWSSDMTPAASGGSAGSPGPVDILVTTDVDTSAVSAADHYDYVAPA